VTADGTIIVGSSWNEASQYAEATMWTRDGAAPGATWVEVPIGVLFGTPPGFGNVVATDISDDGSIIVGWNQFTYPNFKGFIWTEATGMVEAETFLADYGITIEPNFSLQSFSGISGDGTTIIGFGQQTVFPFSARSFVITLVPECPWDCDDGDGVVGITDFLALLAQWGQVGSSCDIDGNGVGITDFLDLLGSWGPCP
jgi:probable HAF family extracellular repeat protein